VLRVCPDIEPLESERGHLPDEAFEGAVELVDLRLEIIDPAGERRSESLPLAGAREAASDRDGGRRRPVPGRSRSSP
jgi:hypothetical protein